MYRDLLRSLPDESGDETGSWPPDSLLYGMDGRCLRCRKARELVEETFDFSKRIVGFAGIDIKNPGGRRNCGE